MNTRFLPSFIALASASLAIASSWAAGPQKGHIPGFLDARTGQFVAQAAVSPQADVDPLAVGVYDGTLALRINVTLKTTVPTAWVISCMQQVTVIDPSGTMITSHKTVKATRNGSTATCNPNIMYSWNINNTNAVVSATYHVYTQGDATVLSDVSVLGNLPNIAVPPDGQTTARTIAVTL